MAAADAPGTARHWIVAIIAAAIDIGGLLMFGGRQTAPPPATMEPPAQQD
ncbi:MAG: hypothetical protein ACREEV_09020 [Dongiaceae bacterium]